MMNFLFDKETEAKFLILVKETIKYCFTSGIAYKTSAAVKDTIFRVCVAISEDKDYLSIYKRILKKNLVNTTVN